MAEIITVRAKCRLFEPNYKIIRAQLDLAEEGREAFGQYIITNILRENGVLENARWYEIVFNPLNLRR